LKIESTKILFAVLNWGLGHATRSLPIIKKLLADDNEIIIASSGDALILLKLEFPDINFIELPDYNVNYSSKNIIFSAASQFLKVLNVIKKENTLTKEIVKKYRINQIISDNRYGIFHSEINSIIITHQLNILMPKGFEIFSPLAQRVNNKLLSNFNQIWIPDFQGENNLSGKLSSNKKIQCPIKYIGPQSRFNKKDVDLDCNFNDYKYEFLAIISGPEPSRAQLEELVINKFKVLDCKTAIVSGKMENQTISKISNIDIFNHLKYADLEKLIGESKIIICRSGYSSIMDLTTLQKKAILIPTSGQTEQEYLGRYHHGNGQFIVVKESNFRLGNLTDLSRNLGF